MGIIVVLPFNGNYDTAKRFIVTEVMYKSLCGEYVVKLDDPEGNEPDLYKTINGIKFKLWKYKDWTNEWVLI